MMLVVGWRFSVLEPSIELRIVVVFNLGGHFVFGANVTHAARTATPAA